MNKYLIYLATLLLLIISLDTTWAHDNYPEELISYSTGSHDAPPHTSTDPSLKLTPEQEIRYRAEMLKEIERLGEELDALEKMGHLAPSAKLALYGFLGTMAFGVTYTQLAYYFLPSRFVGLSWMNLVMRSIVNSFYPSISMGAILGIANFFPTSLPSTNLYTEIIRKATFVSAVDYVFLVAFGSSFDTLSFIVNALLLVDSVYQERMELNGKRSDLKAQLNAARESLRKLSPGKELPELP